MRLYWLTDMHFLACGGTAVGPYLEEGVGHVGLVQHAPDEPLYREVPAADFLDGAGSGNPCEHQSGMFS